MIRIYSNSIITREKLIYTTPSSVTINFAIILIMNIDNNGLRKTTTTTFKKNRLPLLLVNKSHVSASRLCIASKAKCSNPKMIHICGVLENKNHSRLCPARLIHSVSTQQHVRHKGPLWWWWWWWHIGPKHVVELILNKWVVVFGWIYCDFLKVQC